MKKLIKYSGLLALTVVILLLVNQTASAQAGEFTGKNTGTLYANTLAKYLKKYTVYTLNTAEIAAYVRSNSLKSEFVLQLSAEQFKVEIESNDMRGEGFRAVAMTRDGQRPLAQTFANTYKGFENGDKANIVRLNIDDSTFEGYIKVDDKWLYFDKLNRYVSGESNDKIVVYDGKDVIPDPTKKCGYENIHDEKKRLAPNFNENSTASGNCHFVEIATEADNEYYVAYASDASAALYRIRQILNLVEGLYTPSYNVQFILRFQQIWTTSSDPYSGDSLQVILPQFQSWWNANRTAISRDVTHLFTGRTIKNTAVGLAYVGVVCNTSNYYSSVVNYSPVSNSTIDLSAHELGHNFGANHDTAACNGNNIMCPYIQSGNLQWSAQSINSISNYIASSGSCMTENIPTDISYAGNNTSADYLKLIAANHITINSSGGAVSLTNSAFAFLEAGTSIVLTPTNANSLGFLAPNGSKLRIRIGDVLNTCDPVIPAASKSSITSKAFQFDPPPGNGQVQIRPNPFTSFFEIIITANSNDNAHVTVYNAAGAKVKEKTGISVAKGSNKIALDGTSLSKGFYLVEIKFGATRIVQKVVKL